MKKILIILGLILGVFPLLVLAQEEKLVWIDVISPYQNIYVGQTLPIGIAITSADTHTSYKYFFYGGPPPADYTSVQTIGLDGSLINADNILLNIDNLPLFTTDGLGNGYLDTTDAFIGSTQTSGRYYVYVGLFAPDNSTPPNLTSDAYQIYVLPNPNPEPTIEPTLVTPSPSSIPIPTQIPILTLSPAPTLTPTNTIIPVFVSQLSTPTKVPTPTIDPKKYSLLKPTQKFVATLTPDEISIPPDSFLAIIQAGKNPLLDKPDVVDSDNIFIKNFSTFRIIYILLLMFAFLALLYFFYHQHLVSKSDSKKRKSEHLFVKKKIHLFVIFILNLLFFLNCSSVFATTDTITTSQTWVVPSGVTSIIIEAWGGGGAGGSGGTKNKYGGGGGAGGQYVKKTISVSVGQSFSVVVGAGGAGVRKATSNPGQDSGFISLGTGTTHALAKGGLNGIWYDLGGAGGVGTTAGGIGDTIYKGGDGAAGSSSYSGGGGGGPGTTGAGGNASGMTAGVGTTAYGGTGGIGVNGASSAGTVGSIYASGGSGATKNGASGAGATGLILVTYTVFTNDPPSIPTLISPTDSSTGQSLTPTFQTVTTDTNNDNVQYELKICTDSGMTTNCQTFDQTSSNIGWSGQDIGTSAYSSGTTATYVLQIGNSLVENTTYYWKTRAIDYSGSNTWSSTQTTAYSFTTNSRPNTPTLVSPGTGSTQVSLTPELKTVTTDPNSDPLQYKIELCTNEAMSTSCNTYDLSSSITGWSGTDVGTSAYASGTTATYTVQVGSSLAASTTYYWRSYAIDPTGTARWSTTQGTVYSFTTINQAPNKPTNTTPGVGDTEVSTTPTLTASTFSDNDTGDTQNASQFQIATDTGFSSIVWETGTTGPATNSVAVSPALNIGTTYYWRVRYQDNHTDWSLYSDATMFVTEIPPQYPPSIPTLISPSDSSTGQSLTPTFKTVTTDSNSDNVQYELKICTNSSMTTGCQTFDQTSSNIGWSGQDIGTSAYSSGTTATYVLQIGNSLVENTTYYWKARAKDYSGSNTWSSTQTTAYSFTTNSKPNTPTLVSPSTGSTQVSLTPELKTVTTDPNSDPLCQVPISLDQFVNIALV